MEKQYFGKILLFGEYSIICGSKGLVVPYTTASGQWKYTDNKTENPDFYRDSSKHLLAFTAYLGKQDQLKELLDLQLLQHELQNGLYFDSNIPQGYGAGSSGALVAAVFDRFSRKSLPAKLSLLKSLFALAESFFHGSSSGIDPLACYLNETLLIGPENKIEVIDNPLTNLRSVAVAVFLLDTKSTGITAPLVQYFRQRLHEYKFYRALHEVYIPSTDLAINQLIGNDQSAFMETLTKIAVFQRHEMTKMIPDGFAEYFGQSTKNQPFTLKLCGSGGGGFLLGFTVDKVKTTDFFTRRDFNFQWL